MQKASPKAHWRVISASVAGSAHTRVGAPCQDSLGFSTDIRDGVLVVAVADGAGSARHAEVGSTIAAAAAVRTASRLLRLHTHPVYEGVLREILRETFLLARGCLAAEANSSGWDIRELSTTLIVAVCTPEMTGAAQIGDGAVVTAAAAPEADGEDLLTLFSAPQRGEYANETSFITSGDWYTRLVIRVRRRSTRCLAVFTDGVQSLALDSLHDFRPHRPFFVPLIRWAVPQVDESAASDGLGAFLRSSRVSERTDDDLTLLIATLP